VASVPRSSPQTDRVIAVVDLLTGEGRRGLTLAEITRGLGVHKATCHSMLGALTASGWLQRDPVRKTYQLGPELVRVGTAAASRLPALDFARSNMAELASSCRAHCIAFRFDGDHVTVVAQVRAPGGGGHPMPIGTELPLRPPYGAAPVSWAPPDKQEAWLADVPEDVRARFRRTFAATRKRGYAISLHVLPDVRLQQLAALMRSDTGIGAGGRLRSLADQLSDELVRRPEWFVSSLRPASSYEVSHLDAPIFDGDGQVPLMLTLAFTNGDMRGTDVARAGARLKAATSAVTLALARSA
jgi:DNA-binding IclR family transcriptional regulator